MVMGMNNEPYMAMYDVRGIQDYIFKTNYAKEIIGASYLVDSIIINGLREYIKTLEPGEQCRYMLDWEHDDASAFQSHEEILMQVMFIGGGNSYVLFRDKETAHRVNRYLGRYILEHTYSLNLAVAMLKKGDSYAKDYQNINKEMQRIKAKMPEVRPVGALPFMDRDSITGFPLCKERKEHGEEHIYCTEAALKRDAFLKRETVYAEASGKKDNAEKIFDNMVTEKGENSSLAICHIDGNSMGIRIQKRMQNIESYEEAIPVMREISMQIAKSFRETFDEMCVRMDELSPKIKQGVQLYRELIVAGDDITFICNAGLAIEAIQYFLQRISEKGYSACAGISYFNSHFPFSDAYQVAEACCSSAKKRAKKPQHRGTDGAIGCYLDFQICTNVRAAELSSYRDKHYLVDGEHIIARPYYVPSEMEGEDGKELNRKNEKNNIEHLKKWLKNFANEKFIARNRAKKLRNTIPEGLREIEAYLFFLKSRDVRLENPKEQYRYWYDALELLDIDLLGKEGGRDEVKN
ncbi:MAG TPA: hypothetical protein IAA26_14210 [Candidatus Blautia faecipullorum]|nr:hypothetical protein [Candidatus Blautia faecipullorum]